MCLLPSVVEGLANYGKSILTARLYWLFKIVIKNFKCIKCFKINARMNVIKKSNESSVFPFEVSSH